MANKKTTDIMYDIIDHLLQKISDLQKKKKSKPAKNIVINLVNKTYPHNKYYNMELEPKNYTVYITYGKIGSNGGTAINKQFESIYAAQNFMNEQKASKIKKGYKVV